MENNRFERVVFILLKVFGVLSIIGAYLAEDGFFSKEGFLVFKCTTIIGNIYMLSPVVLVEMIVSIIIYLVLIRLIQKQVRIAWKTNKQGNLYPYGRPGIFPGTGLPSGHPTGN